MVETQNESGEKVLVTGNWAVQSRQLKIWFPKLTDSDLKLEPGKEEDMVKRVATKLKKSRKDVITLMNRSQPKTLRKDRR